jgi:hypothetical protein
MLLLSAVVATAGLLGMPGVIAAPTLDPAAIKAAKTAVDHEAIARAYQEEATNLEKEAAWHQELAENYAVPGSEAWMAEQVKHCDAVVSDLKAAAREDRRLAAAHLKMAKKATQ